jgi:cytoskeletal protein RodZ
MVVPGSITSPRDFGAALCAARERSGVRLDVIAERTKIGRRLLEALEAGEFAKLPNRVFVRLFLQQYLLIIGERPDSWLPSFEGTWQRFEDASQPWEVAPPSPSKSSRWLPWAIGSIVVVGGLLAVILVERRQGGSGGLSATATPAALVPIELPAAAASEPTPVPAPTSPPGQPEVLVLRAVGRACWVEVRVAGASPDSRLIAAGEEWRVEAAGQPVALVAGDGGALELEYLGEHRDRVGAAGEVVRLLLGPRSSGDAGPTP